MTELLTAAALAVTLEGALYALFPNAMRRLIVQALALPPATLRGGGLAACGLGVGIMWLIRG